MFLKYSKNIMFIVIGCTHNVFVLRKCNELDSNYSYDDVGKYKLNQLIKYMKYGIRKKQFQILWIMPLNMGGIDLFFSRPGIYKKSK